MNLANKLTLIRVCLVPLLVFVYLFPYASFGMHVPIYYIWHAKISFINILVLSIFALASITDYYDGRIARSQKMITTFGKFADPIADKLLINTIFMLLASDQKISVLIPIIMIARDTIVDAVRMILANKKMVVAASALGKLKTVSQMAAIASVLLNDFPFSYWCIPIGEYLIWFATVISVISGAEYCLKNKKVLTESM